MRQAAIEFDRVDAGDSEHGVDAVGVLGEAHRPDEDRVRPFDQEAGAERREDAVDAVSGSGGNRNPWIPPLSMPSCATPPVPNVANDARQPDSSQWPAPLQFPHWQPQWPHQIHSLR